MNSLVMKYQNDDTMKFLDNFSDVVYRAKGAALTRAANVIKDATKSQFIKSGVSYKPNPKYNDTLIQGIRTTGVIDGDTIKVHIMGTRDPGSGTYRLRFFELGAKKNGQDRYAKTYKGRPLKKPRKLGHISPLKFFETAVGLSSNTAQQVFSETLHKYIEKNA